MAFRMLKRLMTLIGMLKSDSTGYRKTVIIATNSLCFMALFTFWITTFWFTAFEARDPNEYAIALYYMVISLALLLVYLYIFTKRNDFAEMFEELDEMFKKSEYDLKIF